MTQLAAIVGTFLGYTVGYILKIAQKELREFLVGCIKEAMNDKADYGGTNTVAQSEFKRMWNDSLGTATGNGGVQPGENNDQGGSPRP